ncbi:MAG: OmpA family protein [Azospirillum sp.]|nr:OmpA family protein [Azospirillum sp.]
MAAPAPGTGVTIIKKRKKGGHGGHHGGAWKVAYADFVTAMMAFFLLLWLLNVTTSDQKKGVADYFAPVSLSRSTSGAGGVLGGRSLSSPGGKISASTSIAADVPISGVPGAATNATEDAEDPDEPSYPKQKPGETGEDFQERQQKAAEQLAQAAERLGVPGKSASETQEDFARRVKEAAPTWPKQRPDETREEFRKRMDKAATQLGIPGEQPGEALPAFAGRVGTASAQINQDRQEARQFQDTATSLRQGIQEIPDLHEVAKSLVVDQTPDGLRIQLVDQEGLSMFPSGSGQMYPRTRELLALVAKAVRNMPNKVSISGHTDSTPFGRADVRDNWDLSTDRANATRRALIAAGFPEDRIADVVGHADRAPLVKDDPASPRNRRVTIVLLRESKSKSGQALPN